MRPFVVTLTIAMLTLTGTPAAAERITIKDPAHDHVPPGGQNTRGLGDVIRVRVDHAPRRVYVDTVFRTRPYDILEIYFNTRKWRPGPEFVMYKTPFGVTLWRIPAKGDLDRVRCRDMRVRYLPRRHTWASYVNRACLANRKGTPPRRLRVRLLSASDDFYFTRDWVPRKGGASRWVHHN
jgi:hypothetical protein